MGIPLHQNVVMMLFTCQQLGQRQNVITDRKRSTRGGYIFSLSVSSHLGGVPHPADGGGVPHPRSSQGGYPIQLMGGYPIQPGGRGVPHPADGGYPVLPAGGVPTYGTPLAMGTPPAGVPPWLGYPPSWGTPGRDTPSWGTPWLGYPSAGVPLAGVPPHRLGVAVGMPSCVHTGGLSCLFIYLQVHRNGNERCYVVLPHNHHDA